MTSAEATAGSAGGLARPDDGFSGTRREIAGG